MNAALRVLALLFALLCATGAEAANRFLTCATTCTITAIDTSIWGTTTGGTGASVPGSGDAVILDAATCVGGTTCTATMGPGYNPTWQSITMGTCTASTAGCILDFAPNDNNVTLSVAFNCTGTGTRTLNMGDGIWTVSGTTGTVWDCGVITNLTFNANSSTLAFSATPTSSRTINFGGLTYNIVTITNSVASSRTIIWSVGNPTFTGAVTLSNVLNLRLSGTQAYTFNGGLTYNGTSTTQAALYTDGAGTPAATVNVAGAVSLAWLFIQNITKGGAGSITATNSFDAGGNTGVTITGPSGGGRCIGC